MLIICDWSSNCLSLRRLDSGVLPLSLTSHSILALTAGYVLSHHLCGSRACWDKLRQLWWHERAISRTRDTNCLSLLSHARLALSCSALSFAHLECSLGRCCLWGRGLKRHRCGTSGSKCLTESQFLPSLWEESFLAPPCLVALGFLGSWPHLT